MNRFWIKCSLALVLVIVAALAVAVFVTPRQAKLVEVPLNERSSRELVFKDNRFFEPDGETPFTGVLFDTYEAGEPKARSSFSNGFLHGWSQGWHTNGHQQIKEHFVAGTAHGLRTKWHPNGQRLSEVMIVEGKLHGTYQTWHENGRRAEVVEFTHGKADGLARAYFPSGFSKSRVILRDGEVVEQKFWQDGEFNESAPGPLAGK